MPSGDLLHEPQIAVGIVERAERHVAGALGVGPRLPRLDGERGAVPHVSHINATTDECVVGRLDVGDNEAGFGRARRGRCESHTEGDRGPRSRRSELDDAEAVEGSDVIVEPPTQSLVERLGPVDIRHGDDLDFEIHADTASAFSPVAPDTSVWLIAVTCFLSVLFAFHESTLVRVWRPRLMAKLS